MIRTKRQIIDMVYSEYRESKYYDMILRKLLNMPEQKFISDIKDDINWTLEPIRKNQYIVT